MVKHTLITRRLLPTNCLSVFDHFVGVALKGLILQPLVSTKNGKTSVFGFVRKSREYYWVFVFPPID